jgi:hypothetical protein
MPLRPQLWWGDVVQSIRNPLERQPYVIAKGKALFGPMSCIYRQQSKTDSSQKGVVRADLGPGS